MGNIGGLLLQGIGTFIGFALLALVIVWFIQDVTQKKHTILRNFPVVGRLRYLFERQGEYFRQYFFANDREEMPFNRSVRGWVYRLAKDEGGTIGFGSTNNLSEPGNILFVNAPFPTLEEDQVATPACIIGAGYCREPFEAKSIVNISGMSFGAISAPAVRALARGARESGCWMGTGEGGLSPYHEEAGCDLVMQIGTAKYGVRDRAGALSNERLRELAPRVRAFEIKLSQGAKPGKGGVLPAAKVSDEIAAIRGIEPHVDSISPNRHHDIADADQLLDMIGRVRDLTGKPVGVKSAIGGWDFMHQLCEAILRRGPEWAPDFLVIDGGEGGTGAAPQALMDHMALPITEALPRVVDALVEAGLRERIRVVASGKLVTSAKATWALCAGADFVNTARGYMFALGCIQALRCHTNTCPTGITTHNRRLQRGLVVEEKYVRVANFTRNMNREIDMIAHACGLRHAREFRREHVRIVRGAYESVALSTLFPDCAPGARGTG